jgi:hypothetical protein
LPLLLLFPLLPLGPCDGTATRTGGAALTGSDADVGFADGIDTDWVTDGEEGECVVFELAVWLLALLPLGIGQWGWLLLPPPPPPVLPVLLLLLLPLLLPLLPLGLCDGMATRTGGGVLTGSDADVGFADGIDMDWVTGVEEDECVVSTEPGCPLWLVGACEDVSTPLVDVGGREVVVFESSKMSGCAPSVKLYASL